MKIVRSSADCYLVFGIVMMMMMMVMTRRLMMELWIVLRSWMTSLRNRGLMEVAASGRMMMMMVVIFSVSRLLNVIALMRVHRRYRVLLLIRI
jgi:hypothetical protein